MTPSEEQPTAEAAPDPVPPAAGLIASPVTAEHPALESRRLHWVTLVFSMLAVLRQVGGQLAVPIIGIVLTTQGRARRAGREPDGTFLLIVAGAGAALLVLLLAYVVVRYLRFRYAVAGGELVTQEGWLGRKERHIPLSRVQDLRTEQSLLQRLFGVVRVDVETAGGGGPEATLSVISLAEADRLRAAVFGTALPGVTDRAPDEAAPSVPRAALPTPAGETLHAVTLRELILHGLTANHTATALAVVFGAWALLNRVLPRDAEERLYRTAAEAARRGAEQAAGVSPVALAAFALGAGVLVLATMAALSAAGAALLFWGFRLGRSGEDLHRSYGLLTRRASRLPRRRVQLLKIEEEWLRRPFGLATLKVDTAGGSAATAGRGQNQNLGEEAQTNQGGRDVLVPVLPRERVGALLPAVFPEFEGEPAPEWHRVSPRAVRREAMPGILLSLLLAGVFALFLRLGPAFTSSPLIERAIRSVPLWSAALLSLAVFPLFWLRSLLAYRHLGYARGVRFFRLRRGTLDKAEYVVPVRSVQTVTIRRTPFDRRHGLATLKIDTAGQTYTGGGPRIEHLPEAEAWELARSLARDAERLRYRWR